ncbi:hypothetical protein Goklo_029504 [Gossypium klotzschianum]|uniref:Uncharacterized protein n=1 Tax=Gossypium klotzschianum TaxID=34286 RepID=A0A7J8W3L0_9ROSI|nr:hypothetical protein [Gossypium klotzschianum]
MSNTWNQSRRMKRFAVGPMTTPEYNGWWSKRVNDNIPGREFGARKEDRIIGGGKMHLRLDDDVQKLEAKKLRKGNNKAEEDLDSLKTNYKKLRLSMRMAELGKMLEQ